MLSPAAGYHDGLRGLPNPALQSGQNSAASSAEGNPPNAMQAHGGVAWLHSGDEGASGDKGDSAYNGGDRDSVQRMQLEMLKRENAELGSKLETLTQQLRSTSELAGIDHNLESAIAQSDSLDRELCAVAVAKKQQKVPRVKEVLLVFEGDLQTCCRETISAKLLHLKRLLHRRLEARLSPSPEALNSLLQ